MAQSDNMSDNLRASAHRLEEEAREHGHEAARAAKETARDYAERARDEAYARGEAYRDYAAGETGKIASALRRASEDLAEGSPQERLVARLADQVAYSADYMRGMRFEDAYDETVSFARRHPGAFLGGAAVIGFAAARFLKSSGSGGGYAGARTPAPTPPRSAGTGTARPMPNPDVPSASQDPIPEPATQPAGATSPTSPAGSPLDKKPV